MPASASQNGSLSTPCRTNAPTPWNSSSSSAIAACSGAMTIELPK